MFVLLPLLMLPLVTSCTDLADRRDPCERPVTCKEKRPLPILY